MAGHIPEIPELSGLLQYLGLYLRLEHVLPMVLKASLSSIVRFTSISSFIPEIRACSPDGVVSFIVKYIVYSLLQYPVLYLRLEHVLPMVLKASLSSIVPSRFRITRNGKFAKNCKPVLQITWRQKLWIFQPSQLFSRLVLQAKQKLELSKERKNFHTFLVKAFFCFY